MMEGFAAKVMLTKWEGASICTYRDEVGAAAASVLASSGRSRLQSPSAPKQSEHFLYRLVETSQGFMYCSGPEAAVRLERGTKGVHDCFNRCSGLSVLMHITFSSTTRTVRQAGSQSVSQSVSQSPG
jgi:hypothetical protein